MLHYKRKQHRHRRSQKFFHWSTKSTFCLPISGCWRYNSNGRSHNALPFLHHKENDPCYGNSPKNAFSWQQRFFSHRIKVRDLLQSEVIVSLHYLPQMSSTITYGWRPTTATWSVSLLSCYCYAVKVNFRAIGTQVSQPAFAGNLADMSELQARNCVTPQQRTRLLRSGSVISENKTVIARINSIKLLTSGFLENFGS